MTFFDDDPDLPIEASVQKLVSEAGGLDGVTLRAEVRTWFDDVLRFVIGAQGANAVPEKPTLKTPLAELYWKLIEEELLETCEAYRTGDPVAFADGIADTLWVLMGLAIASGIDLRPVWAEVTRSNLDKLGGPRRADGKLMKPPGWKPPDIVSALKRGRVR